jgi:hypothetical protein
MEQHVKIIAVLYIVFGALGILAALMLFFIIAGAGAASGDEEAMMVTGIVAVALAVFLVVVSLPGIIAGIGLLQRRNWARILAIVLAALNLLNFPFGTALGIYALWALLNEQTAPLFAAR